MGIKKSFTFIELVVSIGVITLVLPAVFAIIYSIVNQQLVLLSFQETKRQGDIVHTSVRSLLQNRASRVVNQSTTCPLRTLPTPTYFPQLDLIDLDGYSISLFKEAVPTPRIASSSAAKTYYLTNRSVSITDFGFTCYQSNSYSPPVVTFKYTVSKDTIFGSASLPYFLTIQLRNFQ